MYVHFFTTYSLLTNFNLSYNMISAIFDGAAHVTVAGCLGAFFFKETVVDHTSKAVKEAENVTTGLVISELCISVVVLALVSHKTTQILLSKDTQFPPKHNLAELDVPLICNKISDFSTATESISSNPIATESCGISLSASISSNLDSCTSPSTCTLCTPLLSTWNAKRLSNGSDTTLIDHDDNFMKDFSAADLQESTLSKDDSDCSSGDLLLGMKALTIDGSSGPSQRTQLQSMILKDGRQTTSAATDVSLSLMDASAQTTTGLSLGSILPQIVIPWLKPPDMKRHQNFHPGRDKHKSRLARLAAVRDSIKRTHTKQLEHITMINHLEQLHNELLVDQAALVDGWAAAMAQLGLTSMLSPGPPLLHLTTPNPGTSIEIVQD
ncbi:hypothetical protein DFJ58DRAFT_841336 [Suillus subalutaceus]|uniref:uncharacterized protein n=1 Tax=Suillus subalutaceus TaxID=48586 RepID=UPI001B861889|nr:uncharacterized protein DFJ58DRAFT_841336 [Suillus subalutaceus]KAG1854855.1 hypothetical protein DFJ58DRAFT_841336 [Suillus subalutaceus]